MIEQDLYDILFQNHSRIDKMLANEISSKDLSVNCEKKTDQSENFILSNTDENIQIMEQTANNPSWRDIPRFNKPFGRIAKLIKRIIRKLTKFYIEPFNEQQNQFNKATAKTASCINQNILTLEEKTEKDKNSVIAIKAELERLNAGHEANKMSLLQLSEKTEQTNESCKVAISEVSEKINQTNEDCKVAISEISEKINQTNEDCKVAISEVSEKIDKTNEDCKMSVTKISEKINISREETKAAITQLQEKQTILANKANDTDLSITAIKEIQASQNYQIEKLKELKSELEMAFSRISNMEDCANELREISASSCNKFATLSYAQSGEDQIIQYILKCLRIPINSINYLDLGANHAKEISNTYSFYKQGARGGLLEANPRLIPELKLYRSEDEIIHKCLVSDLKIKSIPFYILNGDGLSSFDKESIEDAIAQNSDLKIETVEEIETITMDEIISNYFPVAPTMLNIDIEGAEEEIISSIDFETWRPLIIIIETIPYHPYLVHDEKRVSLVKQLIEKDYTEYAFTGINSIMLDKKQLK